MSKMITVRLDELTLESVEAVRDRHRFPSQSDFIREAIRRLVREERRKLARCEMIRLAEDPNEIALAGDLAHAGLDDFGDR